MIKGDLKYIKKTFYEQGWEDAKSKRHIEDLCQTFWTDFVRFCHNKLFSFDMLVECFPHYRKGVKEYQQGVLNANQQR